LFFKRYLCCKIASWRSIVLLALSSVGAAITVARGFNPGNKERYEAPITKDVIATHDPREPAGRKLGLRPDDAKPGFYLVLAEVTWRSLHGTRLKYMVPGISLGAS
jgi:hypothetical protein